MLDREGDGTRRNHGGDGVLVDHLRDGCSEEHEYWSNDSIVPELDAVTR